MNTLMQFIYVDDATHGADGKDEDSMMLRMVLMERMRITYMLCVVSVHRWWI